MNLSWVKETKQPHKIFLKVDWFGGYAPPPRGYAPEGETYFRWTKVAKFNDAMWQREGGSESERRVTIELLNRDREGGVEVASVGAVAATARQTHHRRRHRRARRRVTWSPSRPVTWPGGRRRDEQAEDKCGEHDWQLTSLARTSMSAAMTSARTDHSRMRYSRVIYSLSPILKRSPKPSCTIQYNAVQ